MMMEATLPQRSARHARKSAETDISLSLTLDGSGKTDIQTGFGMLDHMLTLTAFWVFANFLLISSIFFTGI